MAMKRLLVLVNFGLSLMAVGSIDTEHSPLWAVFLMLGWFFGSAVWLKVCIDRGMYKQK
jgi:hypothetical protein